MADEITENPVQSPLEHWQFALYNLINMVAHFVCALYTGYIIYTAQPGSSLFSWHPTLMSIATSLLICQAILFFSPQSSLIASYSRKTKATFHWVTISIAGVCALLGISAIYVNKNRNNAPHFQTWHGLIGIITFGYICLQASGGTFLMLPKLIPKGFTLGQFKAYHATSGLLAFALACLSLGLAMCSNWFTSSVTGTSWYACMACPMVLALAIMQQVTSAYLPKPK